MNIFLEILSLDNLIFMNLGLAFGVFIGAMPGMAVSLAITVLLPFTFGMESIPAMFLLLGAYCGGTFGGSITAILINTPGAPAAAATVLDGYPLTKKGQAADALNGALFASTVGGIISCLALIFVAPILASFALKFGPAEYFSLCMFGLCIVVGISGKSISKGLIMAGLGLLISTAGIDTMTGISRFRFGRSELLGGLPAIAVMLGVFAISEVLMKSFNPEDTIKDVPDLGKKTYRIVDFLKYKLTLLRSAIIGVIVGAVPGTGSAIAAFLSYNLAKGSKKDDIEFGEGNIEGILAPESANNAVTGATLIPLLTLGVPGDMNMAILFGALTMQGITPGPELFTEDKFWVWSIMGGLILINIFMFLQGRLLIRAFVRVTKVPTKILIPLIMVFALLGAFSIRNFTFDVFIVMGFGIVGYFLRRFGFPVAPLTIGLVLGQLIEANLRRSMVLSDGSFAIFVTKPLSLLFLILCLASIVIPRINSAIRRKKIRTGNMEQ